MSGYDVTCVKEGHHSIFVLNSFHVLSFLFIKNYPTSNAYGKLYRQNNIMEICPLRFIYVSYENTIQLIAVLLIFPFLRKALPLFLDQLMKMDGSFYWHRRPCRPNITSMTAKSLYNTHTQQLTISLGDRGNEDVPYEISFYCLFNIQHGCLHVKPKWPSNRGAKHVCRICLLYFDTFHP